MASSNGAGESAIAITLCFGFLLWLFSIRKTSNMSDENSKRKDLVSPEKTAWRLAKKTTKIILVTAASIFASFVVLAFVAVSIAEKNPWIVIIPAIIGLLIFVWFRKLNLFIKKIEAKQKASGMDNIESIKKYILETSPGTSPQSIREWSREANRRLLLFELNGFIGVQLVVDENGLSANHVEPLDWREFGLLFLKLRIHLLEKDETYIVSRIMYPIAFLRQYPKAVFRKIAIEEFERFLPDVLAVHTNADAMKEIATVYEEPNRMIAIFLRDLVGLYEKEYRFKKAVALVLELAKRGEVEWVHNLSELFWKADAIDEGLKFLSMMSEKFPKHPESTFDYWDIQLSRLKDLSLKQYRPRPRKPSALPIDEIVRHKRA